MTLDISSLLPAKEKITSNKDQLLLKLTEFVLTNSCSKASIKLKKKLKKKSLLTLPSWNKSNQKSLKAYNGSSVKSNFKKTEAIKINLIKIIKLTQGGKVAYYLSKSIK